ncbi:MAG: TIGR03905 family TSCPD domain-containing protein [Erysipelotrichaceae bacterium]|nr:TIGR03905 family TSCPD domain-containing protein [Erysipelotrichaceae bacterium]
MKFTFTPRGVCSQKMYFDIDGDTILDFQVEGGCNGNLKGIGNLIRGMKVDDVIKALRGTTCGFKPTSCPDQIAQALEAYRNSL